MDYRDIHKNKNGGFSLVELIVVIAIMAVMTAVLAPSLLQYVERSRAQRDDSAMDEVVNAVQLALADQGVYDEMLIFVCDNNWSCYVDKDGVSDDNIVPFKLFDGRTTVDIDKDYYMYNDNERIGDEEEYLKAGRMRGVTLTFTRFANSDQCFNLNNGSVLINEERVASPTAAQKLNYIVQPEPATYNKKFGDSSQYRKMRDAVRISVGDTIPLISQTYRNSNYTVFIRMGSFGGTQASAQDAIHVYGQWGGTNLQEKVVAPPS